MNDPNGRGSVWLDKGTEHPDGTFEKAMGMAQLHNILKSGGQGTTGRGLEKCVQCITF